MSLVTDRTGQPLCLTTSSIDITPRVQAQEALQASIATARALLDATFDSMFLMTVDGVILALNETTAQRLQGTVDDLVGQNIYDYLPSEVIPLRRQYLEKAILDVKPVRFEDELWGAWFDNSIYPITDGTGVVQRVAIYGRDISPRRQAEMALRASEERYRRIVETAQEGMWMIDADTKTTFVNRRMAEMLGYAIDEMIGIALFAFMDEEGRVLAEANFERRRQGISEQHDFKFRRRDGSALWALLSTNPIIDEQGTFLGALAMVVDITERRQTADELYRSQQMLRIVLDNIPQRVFWKDRDLRYLGCNRLFAEDAHLENAAVIAGLTDLELVWQATAEHYRDDDRVVMETDTPKLDFEEPQQHTDGTLLWLRTSKVPLHDREGQVIGILGTYEEITARKQAEEALAHYAAELERSNTDLEHFAYVASHDLQEPLRMVASYVQILAEDYQGKLDPTADEYIGYAVDGAKRMQQLIQDLLAYSRVNTLGKPFEPTDCQTVVADVLVSLKIVIAETGATITVDTLPVVKADRSQLSQVFLNLVGNALKYHSSAAPRVHIGVKPLTVAHTGEPAQWQFSVCDNGIGIDSQYYEKIFVIFQRLHNCTEYTGTGLGLAICKKILERHRGRIWIESESGHGSTFYFILPA